MRETVISALEHADEAAVIADYDVESAVERELWRLRIATPHRYRSFRIDDGGLSSKAIYAGPTGRSDYSSRNRQLQPAAWGPSI